MTTGTSQRTSQIEGVVLRELVRHGDERGGFTETYRQEWFDGPAMVQGNRSDSAAGVVRGLHYHLKQSDYWVCLAGRIIVCLHDIRPNSSSRGVTEAIEMKGDSSLGLYIPPGVLHGFGAIEDSTLTYLVDHGYDSTDEFGVRFDDPQIAMDWEQWGFTDPVLSPRDSQCGLISDLDPATLPA
jgi:dTDP-4-dehydrorhamnose 3,5-epimerase